jgi:hypothetical protein
MAPLKNGIGCKDIRSIRSNQSSQGIAIELLSNKVSKPAGNNPELMVYKKISSRQTVDLSHTMLSDSSIIPAKLPSLNQVVFLTFAGRDFLHRKQLISV